jgi:hypothetical protein
MSESVSKPMSVPPVAEKPGFSIIKFLIIKFLGITILVAVLVYLQAIAAKNTYDSDHQADIKLGVLHGMLMPAALPGLFGGHDLPIYAPNNTGRGYKIGYILGINTSGTLFFGAVFWRPKKLKWP